MSRTASRRVVMLTADVLDALPDPCRRCLFWELGERRPDVRGGTPSGGETLRKQAWEAAVGLDWGPPGRVVQVDGRTVAYALFGPAGAFAPPVWPVPHASDDALLLATLWVEPGYREGGLGKLLLQAAVKEALARDLRAVEVYGDRRFFEAACLLPSQWLLHAGFQVHREHPRLPLLRLDVRRTLRWAESLEHALDEVLERLPRTVPSPRRAPGAHPVDAGQEAAVSGSASPAPARNAVSASVRAAAIRSW